MNVSANKKVLTILFLLLAILLPLSATAQGDGGRRKRPKPKTEQTPPTKNPPAKRQRPDYNGHDYVDLGLPSGLKWGTCNIGASSPEEYGGYYAWGETTTKSSYDKSNSLTHYKRDSELRSAGIVGASGNLTMQYDAARANWGGSWRIPTKTECQELKDRCVWNWTSQNGHTGYKVVGPNGNSIFLPAAGDGFGMSVFDVGKDGSYHSSTRSGNLRIPDSGSIMDAFVISFSPDSITVQQLFRYVGRQVRPVSE